LFVEVVFSFWVWVEISILLIFNLRLKEARPASFNDHESLNNFAKSIHLTLFGFFCLNLRASDLLSPIQGEAAAEVFL
jgi:hypothetical protein